MKSWRSDSELSLVEPTCLLSQTTGHQSAFWSVCFEKESLSSWKNYKVKHLEVKGLVLPGREGGRGGRAPQHYISKTNLNDETACCSGDQIEEWKKKKITLVSPSGRKYFSTVATPYNVLVKMMMIIMIYSKWASQPCYGEYTLITQVITHKSWMKTLCQYKFCLTP